jgi:hypothetical protein
VDFFTAASLCWRCDVRHTVIAEGVEQDQSGSFAFARTDPAVKRSGG